jgi:hypothetical protein
MRASLPLGHHVVAFATLPAGFMLPSAPTNDAPPPALVRENADEPKDEDFICFYRTQSSPVTTRPRRRRCVTSTSLAITSFVYLMRRSPDARVRTSASGSAENDDISYSFSKKASAIENTRDLASYCRSPEKGTIGMSEFRIQRRHCSVGDTWKRFLSVLPRDEGRTRRF